MKRFVACFAMVLVAVSSLLMAQESQQPPALPEAKPEKEHQWLQQFVGTWETNMEAMAMPGQPAIECKGTIESRSLGGFWIVSEMKSEMMGTSMTGVQSIGFDPKSKQYIGTWIDSMTSYMWKYKGSVDSTGKVLTLEAEGPNFMQDGELTKFRDIYEFQSPDRIKLTSSMLGEDGEWVAFMTGEAKRKQ